MKEEEIKNQEEQQAQDSAETPVSDSVADTPSDEETTENNDTQETAEEKDPLEAAKDEIEQLKDKYLRSVAEFDNYRKRTLKEKAELILNGGEKAVSAILPVIDDMERAIENGEKTDDPQVLREGMELIYQKFIKDRHGIRRRVPYAGGNLDG